jgi:carboxymethylenebutenolidase
MEMRSRILFMVKSTLASLLAGALIADFAIAAEVEGVTFPVGEASLHADLAKPAGGGPYPAVIWNHGGANPRPGATPYSLSSVLGELFANNGYVLLVPHRRGYGRSPRYELADKFRAEKNVDERNRIQLELMDAYMPDIGAAIEYLRGLPFIDPTRVVVAGCSFGGSLALFSAEKNWPIRAVVNFAGAAVSWKQSSELRERMIKSAGGARVPVLLIQAENDYDLEPTRALAQEFARVKKPHKTALFPPHGSSAREGHNFCETGGKVWEKEVMSFLASATKN